MNLPLRVDLEKLLGEVAQALGASCLNDSRVQVRGIALDTRALQKGDLFFALKGARDGHAFIPEAFRKGACAVVAEQDGEEAGPVLKVPDTLKALLSLGAWLRQNWSGQVVGISGSNGKTTTKEMTAAILSSSLSVVRAPGNWNNLLGVSLSLGLLRPKHQVAVLEMGMNDFGELAQLCQVSRPTITLLTNVGPAHLEKFGSLERVAKAKAEIFSTLTSEDTAVINLDDPHVCKISQGLKSRKVTVSMNETADVQGLAFRSLATEGSELEVSYGGEKVLLRSSYLGKPNAHNLLCALGVARAVGVEAAKLQVGLDQATAVEMRMELIELPGDITVVKDCYNANPASMAAALEVTHGLMRGRKIAVLGDMMELGDYAPRAHRDVGIKVAQLGYSHLFSVGQYAGDFSQGAVQGGMSNEKIRAESRTETIVPQIVSCLEPGDVVLVKGSRAMKMEEVVERLRAEWEERA